MAEACTRPRAVLASGNRGKLVELQALLAPLNFELRDLSAFALEGPPEPALTFVENALIKARHACEHTGWPSIADDSGIAVAALKGQPGVRSARYAGAEATDTQNLEKLLEDLAVTVDRDRYATFHTCVVYMRHAHDPAPLITHGRWHGVVLDGPSGDAGFGYDPVFGVPERDLCSAAALSFEQKNQLSHRGKALRAMVELLSQELA
jgi:XTP/dITP diphosphohydrolase